MENLGFIIAKYLSSGNLEAVDFACRSHLENQDRERNMALMGLAFVACRMGYREHEQSYLNAIAKPYSRSWRPPSIIDFQNFNKIHSEPKRYLVIKSRGCGFWSEISHVVSNYMIARRTDRIPIVDWGAPSLYTDNAEENAFTDFFLPLSDLFFQDGGEIIDLNVIERDNSISIKKIDGNAGNRYSIFDIMQDSSDVLFNSAYIHPLSALEWILPEPSLSLDEIRFNISSVLRMVARPKSIILQEVAQLKKQLFDDEPYIAIHLRGLDKQKEVAGNDEINWRLLNEAETLPVGMKTLIITDDQSWAERASSRLRSRAIFTDSVKGSGNQGIHGMSNAPISRRQLGEDVLVDTYLATESSFFIGNAESNVASIIDLLRYGTQGQSILAGENILIKRRDWGHINW